MDSELPSPPSSLQVTLEARASSLISAVNWKAAAPRHRLDSPSRGAVLDEGGNLMHALSHRFSARAILFPGGGGGVVVAFGNVWGQFLLATAGDGAVTGT